MLEWQITWTLAVTLVVLMMTGCHTRVPIVTAPSASSQSAAFTGLTRNDKVRVTLRNGDVTECVVAEAQAEALVASDGRRFPYTTIARLEKIRVSKVRTVALTAGLIAIGFMIGIAFATASLVDNI